MIYISLNSNQKGFVTFLITILVLIIILGIIVSISFLIVNEHKILRNIIKSNQAYFVAEAGIEDALLRLNKGINFSSPYNLTVGQGTATIEISNLIGGSRTIISSGSVSNRIRKIRAIWAMSTEGVSFNYGAQAGDGGIDMESNSVIHGNVFSNGTVRAVTGTAQIDNSLVVAKSGNKIIDLIVGTVGSSPVDEARAHTCLDSTINGDLYYVSGGSSNCTVNGGSEHILPQDIESVDLPISDEQITNWKAEAITGGIESMDHIVSGGTTEYFGPKKIEADLKVENNATLILTGILWVTGNVLIENGAIIRLDSGYGPTSGLIVADGTILAENGAILEGSGTQGSYLMLLSTNSSIEVANPAIFAKNNAIGAIFYASDGMIRLRNNINILEATGEKLYLDNNAEITYESGLINSLFSSGPEGSWKIVEWKEIE